MTLDAISSDDRLLLDKLGWIESMLRDPAQEITEVPFSFSIEETEAMSRLWQRGLIEPATEATAQFTVAGLDEIRRLRD